jgi:hypothetical protein
VQRLTVLPTEKSQKEIATAIGRTSRQVHNLTEQGVFTRVPSTADPTKLVYPWPATLEAWVAHSANATKEKSKRSGKRDVTQDAKAREALADAAMKEFRLEQMRGEWVRRDASELLLRSILSAIIGVMDLAPGKHGPRLPGDYATSEKVAAVRAVMREIRSEMRRSGGEVVAGLLNEASETAA